MDDKQWQQCLLEVIFLGLLQSRWSKQEAKKFLREGVARGLWSDEDKDELYEELYLKKEPEWNLSFEAKLRQQMREYLSQLQLPKRKDILELTWLMEELLQKRK